MKWGKFKWGASSDQSVIQASIIYGLHLSRSFTTHAHTQQRQALSNLSRLRLTVAALCPSEILIVCPEIYYRYTLRLTVAAVSPSEILIVCPEIYYTIRIVASLYLSTAWLS